MENFKDIPGWGSDLDHSNRPGVPMERTPPRLDGYPFPTPSQQPVNMEILVSPEHNGITPIFGTGPAPKGLSGVIRRQAFKTTENDIRHWLLLMLADRINVVEGLGEDLVHGKFPHVLDEMGIRAEMKHNPQRLAKRVGITVGVLAVVVGLGCWLFNK